MRQQSMKETPLEGRFEGEREGTRDDKCRE